MSVIPLPQLNITVPVLNKRNNKKYEEILGIYNNAIKNTGNIISSRDSARKKNESRIQIALETIGEGHFGIVSVNSMVAKKKDGYIYELTQIKSEIKKEKTEKITKTKLVFTKNSENLIAIKEKFYLINNQNPNEYQKETPQIINEKVIKTFKYSELIKEYIYSSMYIKVDGIPGDIFHKVEFDYHDEDQFQLLKNINQNLRNVNKKPLTKEELQEEIASFKKQIDEEIIQEFKKTLLLLDEKVYLTVLSRDELAITMPKIKGRTLADFIINHSHQLSTNNILKIVIGFIEQIEFCFSKGLIHLDFYTENVLIDDDFNIRLIDFGNMSEISERHFRGGCETILEEILLPLQNCYSADAEKNHAIFMDFYKKISASSNIQELNKVKNEMVSKKQEVEISFIKNNEDSYKNQHEKEKEKSIDETIQKNSNNKNYTVLWKNSFFHKGKNAEDLSSETNPHLTQPRSDLVF